MILVDTSVWVDHLRGRAGGSLGALLEAGDVLVHPWVLAELALGHLGAGRAEILRDLGLLPRVPVLRDEEVMALVEAHRLAGSGVGWVDAHLLGAALVGGVPLWTNDRVLGRVASRLGTAL